MVKIVGKIEQPGSFIIEVESDALTVKDAIYDIDEWAVNHGAARWPSTFLRRLRRKDTGQVVYRGICYVQTDEEIQAIGNELRKWKAEAEAIPNTKFPMAR